MGLAHSLVGSTLYGLQNTVMVENPWHSYAYDWCAVFTSWLLRSVGAGSYQTYASGQYEAFTPVASPAVGDIIYYPNPGHVGIVAAVSGSGVPSTIEGNVPGVHWSESRVKTYPTPWQPSGYIFSRPPYATSEPTSSEEEEGTMYYQATSSSSDGLIQSGYIYINAADGPLRALSSLEGSARIAAGLGFVAGWSGADLRTLVKIVGFRQQGPAQGLSFQNGSAVGNDGRLTGTIVY